MTRIRLFTHRHRAPAVAVAALLALPALTAPAWGTPAATDDEPATLTCARQGTMVFEPGLTMTHKDFTVYELGSLGPCVGSDGSVLRGFVSSVGSGSGTCASAYITDAPFMFGWSDGTTSKGRALASTVGPVAFGIGEITSGRFAGMAFSTRPTLMPHNPERCASTGVTRVDYHGEIVFE